MQLEALLSLIQQYVPQAGFSIIIALTIYFYFRSYVSEKLSTVNKTLGELEGTVKMINNTLSKIGERINELEKNYTRLDERLEHIRGKYRNEDDPPVFVKRKPKLKDVISVLISALGLTAAAFNIFVVYILFQSLITSPSPLLILVIATFLLLAVLGFQGARMADRGDLLKAFILVLLSSIFLIYIIIYSIISS